MNPKRGLAAPQYGDSLLRRQAKGDEPEEGLSGPLVGGGPSSEERTNPKRGLGTSVGRLPSSKAGGGDETEEGLSGTSVGGAPFKGRQRGRNRRGA
jgi:hypothetical protein